MWIFISLSFFFVKVLLCCLLVTSTFSWGALFISEHNLLHQVTRAELRDSTHSPRYSTGSRWLGNSLAASFFLFVSVSEYFGTFVGSFFSVCLTVCGIFFPPLSPSGAIATLHAQTSRNVTGFCHRDCGGALSAVLTCTESSLGKHKQYNGSACVWKSLGSQLLPHHWEAGGGGAGIPIGGGAHLQPLLRSPGEVRWLLRRWEPGVSSHSNHKRYHAAVENQAIRTRSRICWDDVCGASNMWM